MFEKISLRIFGRNDSDWARVLEVMYEQQITLDPDNLYGEEYTNTEDADFLIKIFMIEQNCELDKEEVIKSVNYLKDVELVEGYEGENGNTCGLSHKGFVVAHQQRRERQQQTWNLLLTGTLIMIGFLSLLLTGALTVLAVL